MIVFGLTSLAKARSTGRKVAIDMPCPPLHDPTGKRIRRENGRTDRQPATWTKCRGDMARVLPLLTPRGVPLLTAWCTGPSDFRVSSENSAYLGLIILPSKHRTAANLIMEATDLAPRWARREQIELDGLKYDICVAARGGAYIGVWMCRECGEHGASSSKISRADQASTRAQIDLCAHHNLVHRRPRRPK